MSDQRELHGRAAAAMAELGALVIQRRKARREVDQLRRERDRWEDENDLPSYKWPRIEEYRDADGRLEMLADDLVDLSLNAFGCALLAMSAPSSPDTENSDKETRHG